MKTKDWNGYCNSFAMLSRQCHSSAALVPNPFPPLPMARRHAALSPIAADIELLEPKQLLSGSAPETEHIDALLSDTSSLLQLLSGSQQSAPVWDGHFDDLSETEATLQKISALTKYGEQITDALGQIDDMEISKRQEWEMQLLEVMHAMENAIDTTASFEDAMRSSIHHLLTEEISSADLSALSLTEGQRMAIGSVPLSDPAHGSITVVVPRGKSPTATLQEETRWTQPPTLVSNPDHGFGASQSTIPASIVDWKTRKIEGFGLSSIDDRGTILGGTVWNSGIGMPVVHNLTTGTVRGLGSPFRGSTDITISPDGSRAATSTYGTGRNGTMRVWDTATGAEIGETQRPEYVTQMAFRPGDTPDLFYSTEYGQYVSWNKVNGDGGHIFEGIWPRFAVSESIAAAPRIVDLGRGRFEPSNTVELYDLIQERKLPAIATGASVRDLAISPDGTVLLTWERGGIVHMWNITTQQKITTITPTAGTRDARAQFSNNGSLIIITDNMGKLREFSVESLRSGNTEPLVQRTYDTRDSILAHPGAPGYIASRATTGSVSLSASGLPAIITNGQQVPAAEGKGDGTVWLDYSSVNHLVTQAKFRITGVPSGTQFTVTPFLGTQRLAAQSASAGDMVSLSNAEGLSAVAVQGVGWNGPIALAQMDVSTLSSAPTADSKALGLLSNDLFAQTWADTDEVWGDKWLDYRSQMAAVEGDRSLPMLVRATGGTLYGFTYHTNVQRDRKGNAKSLARSALPESAFIRIDASTTILLPGYPAALYVNVGDGTIVGTRKGQNGGIILEKKQSANILDLVPKEGMDVRVDWLDTVSAGEGTREGFFREDLTPGVVSHRSPEGGAIETTMRVKNSGSSGGTIRAEIYVSSDLHPEHVLQKTIEGHIDASDILTLRFRADVPARDRSAYAYVKIIGPDGTVLAEEGAGHVGRNPEKRSADDIQDIRDGIADAQQQLYQNTVQYWVDMARSSPVYAKEAKEGLQETLSAMTDTIGTTKTYIRNARHQVESALRSAIYEASAGTTGEVLAYNGILRPLEIPNGERKDPENLSLPAEGSETLRFTIDKTVMANFWVQSFPGRALSLTISGGTLPAGGYSSDHGLSSADSTSLKLTPGTYDVTVRDRTNYDVMPNGNDLKSRPLDLPLHMDVREWNMREVVGKVSLPGEREAKDVSLRVAEFGTDGKRSLNYDGSHPEQKLVSALDPSKPVWVVAHGRENSENSSQIAELTRNLQLTGTQVVTLDWSAGASDNDIPLVGLEGSKWIESVGSWAARQLQSMQISGSNVNGVGHSWGSYVVYEMGAHLPGGIKTLVALDPAADTPVLGGGKYKGFADESFSFSNVAESSYAFHSSNFGNRKYALSAEYAFDVVVPENYEDGSLDATAIDQLLSQRYLSSLGLETLDELSDAYREHGFAVSLFSELLQRQRLVAGDVTAKLFSLQNLQSDVAEFLKRDGNYEGTFYVDPNVSTNELGSEAGQSIWKAKTFGFRSKAADGADIIQSKQL